MSRDEMREEFEAWVKSKWPETDLSQFNDGEYCGFTLGHCWSAWQASREALLIELPEPYAVIGDYAACGGGRSVWDSEYAEKITDRMCEKTSVYDMASLIAAGLKVRS